MKYFFIFYCFSFSLISTAYSEITSGGEDSGGGDVVICKISETEERTYLADIYPLRNHPFFNKWNKLPGSAIREVWLEELSLSDPAMSSNVAKVLDEGQLSFGPTAYDLPELDDDNIAINDKNCHKKQLAIQKFKDGDVSVNTFLKARLSPAQKMLFHLHEALIFLRKRAGDTSELRSTILNNAIGRNYQKLLEKVLTKLENKKVFYPSFQDKRKIIEALAYNFTRIEELNEYMTFDEFKRTPSLNINTIISGKIFLLKLSNLSLHLDTKIPPERWLKETSLSTQNYEDFINQITQKSIPYYSYASSEVFDIVMSSFLKRDDHNSTEAIRTLRELEE